MSGVSPKQELVYDEARAALFEEGKLVEYMRQADPNDYAIGAICHARITQTFPKQKRAQCQLDNGQMASFRLDDKAAITAVQLCWITLSAMGRQHKPWQAEQGISRGGRLIVLHHGRQGVRLSHKAKGQIDETIISAVNEALPEGWGAVLKRASIAATQQDIITEISLLLAPLSAPPLSLPIDLRAQAATPLCLYRGDDAKTSIGLSGGPDMVARYEGDSTAWDEIEDTAKDGCEREVILPNGALLHFEQTQALMAVDVDSATSKLAPLALAKYCAPQIMRHIRLASYSGVIVVDMPRLGMKDMGAIVEMMREAAARDIRNPDVLGVSRAGLIEIVVRHRLSPLAERLTAT